MQNFPAMLDGDAFLIGPKGEYFTNPMFHALMEHALLIARPITAPKMAFIVVKVAEFLGRDSSSETLNSSLAEGSDSNSLYDAALKKLLEVPGKHSATRRNQKGLCWFCFLNQCVTLCIPAPSGPQIKTMINIIVPPEVTFASALP